MHVLWIILLAIVGLLLLALVWPISLHVEGVLTLPRGAEATARLLFFSGLFRLTYRIKANLYEKPPLHVLLFHGKESPRVLWRPGQEKKPRTKRMELPLRQIWRHVRIRRLNITGALGVKDDAFYTALLSGMLSSLLQATLAAGCGGKDAAPAIDIAPDFSGGRLLLNLEGIASCPPRPYYERHSYMASQK